MALTSNFAALIEMFLYFRILTFCNDALVRQIRCEDLPILIMKSDMYFEGCLARQVHSLNTSTFEYAGRAEISECDVMKLSQCTTQWATDCRCLTRPRARPNMLLSIPPVSIGTLLVSLALPYCVTATRLLKLLSIHKMLE